MKIGNYVMATKYLIRRSAGFFQRLLPRIGISLSAAVNVLLYIPRQQTLTCHDHEKT